MIESAFFRNILRDKTIHKYWLLENTLECFELVQHFLLRHDFSFNIDSHLLRVVFLLTYSLDIKRLKTLLLDRLVERLTKNTRAFVLDASCSKISSQNQLKSLIDANIHIIELDIRIAHHLRCEQTGVRAEKPVDNLCYSQNSSSSCQSLRQTFISRLYEALCFILIAWSKQTSIKLCLVYFWYIHDTWYQSSFRRFWSLQCRGYKVRLQCFENMI